MPYKTLSEFFLWNNPKSFADSIEETNRYQNAILFPYSFSNYNRNSSIYNLVVSSILLDGFKNKKKLDYIINNFTSEQLRFNLSLLHQDMHFFMFNNKRIYLPFFSNEINEYYDEKIYELKDSKYKDILKDEKKYYINPFDFYKDIPFLSTLTRLIYIGDLINAKFYFHDELETILVISNDGQLENEFPIFDERIKKDPTNLLDRINDARINYQKDASSFLKSLDDNKLISHDFYKKANHLLLKRSKR